MSPTSAQEELSQKRRQARSRAMAQAVVAAFTERLQEEAQKQGGSLSLRQIQELNTEFEAKADQLSTVFEQALIDAAREQDELNWHAIKRPAFDRLMVKRFEHLFIQRGGDGIPHGEVSRRILPGFFLSLNMMLGPEALERYQRLSDAAVERVMHGQTPVNWKRVSQAPEVLDILLDAQLAIALHFDDTQKRSEWFIQITNAHLAPVAYEDAPDAQWELTPPVLHDLIHHLLSDLNKAVFDDTAWPHFLERHPEADRHHLASILDRLQ